MILELVKSPRLISLFYCFALLLLLVSCQREKKIKTEKVVISSPEPSLFQHCARSLEKLTSSAAKLQALKPPYRFGVLADTKEASLPTLTQLENFARYLVGQQAQAVIILGGLDTRFEGLVEILRLFSKHKLLVLGLPGDRESLLGWQAAMREIEAGGIDFTLVRALELPGLSLLAVPGYFRVHHLQAKEQGCSYDETDIKELTKLARALPAPRLLLSHGPPAGSGTSAIDRAFGEENIGDPLLRRLMHEGDFRFGLFAHVHESAGRAQLLDGKPAAPSMEHESLLLNVGSADAVAHENLAGQISTGDAALIDFDGGHARFKIIKLAKEKKQ